MMRRFELFGVLLMAAAIGSGACSRNPKPEPPTAAPAPAATPPPPAKPAPPPPPPPAAPAPTPAPPTEAEIFGKKTLDQLNAEKPLADALFAYDSTDLNDAARAALQKNVEWLKRWTSTRIMVEGHADARGTNEYNLALGERRADVVRDYLVSLGLPTERVTTVSKGEEQPACSEDTESCWQQNRRGHFIITGK
jgi:peptidoglycan-associated lipoprotein